MAISIVETNQVTYTSAKDTEEIPLFFQRRTIIKWTTRNRCVHAFDATAESLPNLDGNPLTNLFKESGARARERKSLIHAIRRHRTEFTIYFNSASISFVSRIESIYRHEKSSVRRYSTILRFENFVFILRVDFFCGLLPSLVHLPFE